jgi:hypothetical protein
MKFHGLSQTFPYPLYMYSSNTHKENRSDHCVREVAFLSWVLSHICCIQAPSQCQLPSTNLSCYAWESHTKAAADPGLWKSYGAIRGVVCTLLTLPALLLFRSLACCVCMENKAKQENCSWRRELTNFLWLFQADLKKEISVLGKPPHSPVMSKRCYSSPVNGPHRVGSERPHLWQPDHLASQWADSFLGIFVVICQQSRAGDPRKTKCPPRRWAMKSDPKSLGCMLLNQKKKNHDPSPLYKQGYSVCCFLYLSQVLN